MRKFLLFFSCLALMASFATAHEITLDQAASIAKSFGRNSSAKLAPTKAQPQLIYTEQAEGTNLYYVFNRPNQGFIIVAADDNATTVLAYSDTQNIDDINTLPDNMKAWLDGYARQIKAVVGRSGVKAPHQAARVAISPLIKTKWSQSDPFNKICPSEGNQRCVTGCVATTMAQVMKYYEYPTKGTGHSEYEYEGQVLSTDFHEYRWADMLNEYTTGAAGTNMQQAAVAELFYDAAISVKMQFGTKASGSLTSDAATAFIEHFGYDKSLTYEPREFYTDEGWADRIYNELAAKRPVIYDGNSTKSGSHTFIIDGADANGLFHVNWGWAGWMNGYYALTGAEIFKPNTFDDPKTTTLYTPEQYADTYYEEGQHAIFGLQPDKGGSYNLLFGSALQTSIYSATIVNGQVVSGASAITEVDNTKGEYFIITGKFICYIPNYTQYHPLYKLGVQARNITTGQTSFIESLYPEMSFDYNQYLDNIVFSVEDFITTGQYELHPAFRDPEGTWHVMQERAGDKVAQLVVKGQTPDIYLNATPVLVKDLHNDIIIKATVTATKDIQDVVISPFIFIQDKYSRQIGMTYETGLPYDVRQFSLEISMNAGQTRDLYFETDYSKMDAYKDRISLYLFEMRQGTADIYNDLSKWAIMAPTSRAQLIVYSLNFDDETAIEEMQAATEATRPVDVYTLAGTRIRKAVSANQALRGLPAGIYIVDGKKIAVK